MINDEYGLQYWSKDNFFIEDGLLKVNHGIKPSIFEILQKAKESGVGTPLIVRFPHLIDKQMDRLYSTFGKVMEKESYSGNFQAVFPLKVNQYKGFLDEFVRFAPKYNYGVEAGSKAELLLAISIDGYKAPITVNGFKDMEMIELGFIASQIGHDITLIIESLSELEYIFAVAPNFHKMPNIGIRIRLYSYGSGTWAKSGGMDSKFGLTATELIQALDLLKENNFVHQFKMIHFHIGSQINSIYTLQKAIREVGQIYAELRRMGAINLDKINLGGGLAVNYGQHKSNRDKNYTTEEFVSNVVKLLKEISVDKKVEVPNIFTEFGRYISANHSLLLTEVIELYSQDYTEDHLSIKNKNPKTVKALKKIYRKLDYGENSQVQILEMLHDTIEHLDSIETLFELGYLDLRDRANIEILGQMIIRKILKIIKKEDIVEYEHDSILHKIEERYLLNFSIFQSMPDFWGLQQNFPIVPIHHLDKKAVRPASIWDITCDSDGEIEFDEKAPLFLHDIDIEKEDYYLAFFLTGAYQDILGMKHNLFDRPDEIIVDVTENSFEIAKIERGKDIGTIIDSVGYSENDIFERFSRQIENLEKEKSEICKEKFKKYLRKGNYLKF
ncbi:arginine decarboxylase (spermidine biosynthesis) [Thiovulum sp. ES]|nr:arginine decarboxylase (spermidine biosynthesis) [Thiovulum sp. ES]